MVSTEIFITARQCGKTYLLYKHLKKECEMDRLEAIQKSIKHWEENVKAIRGDGVVSFNRTVSACALCTEYQREGINGCGECPLKELGQECHNTNSAWQDTRSRSVISCQNMLDVLKRCEDIELRRLGHKKIKDKSLKYLALNDGTGYKKGDVYESKNYTFGRDLYGCYPNSEEHPFFYKEQLAESSDFELVKETIEHIVIFRDYDTKKYLWATNFSSIPGYTAGFKFELSTSHTTMKDVYELKDYTTLRFEIVEVTNFVNNNKHICMVDAKRL